MLLYNWLNGLMRLIIVALELADDAFLRAVAHVSRVLLGHHVISLIILFALLAIVYRYLRGVYRKYLHPLSIFSGPAEAAISDSWIQKQDASGCPEKVLERMHKKYDTKALRIAPNHIHISDIDMYKVIYSQIGPFPKHAPFYAAFNAPHTAFTKTDPVKHKTRRQMLSPAFSRAGALKLEPVIRQKLAALDHKTQRLLKEGDIDIYPAMRALTTEIIMQFAFGRSGGMIEENEHNFTSWFSDSLSVASHGFHTMLYNPLTRHIGNCLPIPLVTFLKPDVGKLLSLLKFASESVDYWNVSEKAQAEGPVLFDKLTGISRSDMATEAVDIIIAGADTTAMSAAVAIVEILTNPTIEAKLVRALDVSIPSRDVLPPLLELEKIEYLTACVKEAIRFTAAVPGRLPRVVPNGKKVFIVENKIIPPGTVVSMSAHTMHTSVDTWGPDARSFNPDRWLRPDAKNLEQYQVAFSKGARMCLGQNIAPAEITCVLALLFRKYAVTLAPDFRPPRKVDVFTLEFEAPGVPIRFTLRS